MNELVNEYRKYRSAFDPISRRFVRIKSVYEDHDKVMVKAIREIDNTVHIYKHTSLIKYSL
jgi:hypothetical protein